jgi:hypothetical protein
LRPTKLETITSGYYISTATLRLVQDVMTPFEYSIWWLCNSRLIGELTWNALQATEPADKLSVNSTYRGTRSVPGSPWGLMLASLFGRRSPFPSLAICMVTFENPIKQLRHRVLLIEEASRTPVFNGTSNLPTMDGEL